MSADVRQELADRSIQLGRYRAGEHRAACPWCDKGLRDDALAVKIDRARAQLGCAIAAARRAASASVARPRAVGRRLGGSGPSGARRFRTGAGSYGTHRNRSSRAPSRAAT